MNILLCKQYSCLISIDGVGSYQTVFTYNYVINQQNQKWAILVNYFKYITIIKSLFVEFSYFPKNYLPNIKKSYSP